MILVLVQESWNFAREPNALILADLTLSGKADMLPSKSDLSDVSNETIEEAIAQYDQEI